MNKLKKLNEQLDVDPMLGAPLAVVALVALLSPALAAGIFLLLRGV